MARVTVEDCLHSVDNRFELVLLASRRARQLANGQTPLVETTNDKVTVLALREIAAGKVNFAFVDASDKMIAGAGIEDFEAPEY